MHDLYKRTKNACFNRGVLVGKIGVYVKEDERAREVLRVWYGLHDLGFATRRLVVQVESEMSHDWESNDSKREGLNHGEKWASVISERVATFPFTGGDRHSEPTALNPFLS